jgi:hypothetical protein
MMDASERERLVEWLRYECHKAKARNNLGAAKEYDRLVVMLRTDSVNLAAARQTITTLTARVSALEAEAEKIRAALLDPANVHLFMLRGVVAKPTWRQLAHLIGDYPTEEESLVIENAKLRTELVALHPDLSTPRPGECPDALGMGNAR